MRRMTMAMFLAAVCSAGALAQSGSTTTGQMTDHGKMMKKGTVVVTGCVGDKDSMGHYMLNNAMMSDHMMDKSMPSTSGGDMKMMAYVLSGGDLKMHVGHKVEITGMMEPAKKMKMKMDKMDTMSGSDKDKMMSDMLKVTSVKMISATCQ